MAQVEALRTDSQRIATRPEAAAFGYRVEIETEYSRVQSRWERLAKSGAALSMQRKCWLSAFYASVGQMNGIEPLLATVVDSLSGRDLMALPLIRVKHGRLRVVEFADHGLTDYNAPIIGPFVPRDLKNVREIWRAIRNALPGVDLVSLDRMPSHINGMLNPLTLLDGIYTSSVQGFRTELPDDFEAWRNRLDRRFRRELDRGWRFFNDTEGADFCFATNSEEARNFFFSLKRHQKSSIADLDEPYFLDQPSVRRFYDSLFADGLADGSVKFSVLRAGQEPVAALLSLRDGNSCTLVHLATAGGRWRVCSPGRLIIDSTIQALHAEGCRTFDFTIGDYPYKRHFGAQPVRLLDAHIAVTWRGLPTIISERSWQAIGRNANFRKAINMLGVYR